MHKPEEENEDEDSGYFKAGFMSFMAIIIGVWIPNFVTSMIYSNNQHMFGHRCTVSNFMFCKYYLNIARD